MLSLFGPFEVMQKTAAMPLVHLIGPDPCMRRWRRRLYGQTRPIMAVQLRLLGLIQAQTSHKREKPGDDGRRRAVTETVLGPRPALVCRHLSQGESWGWEKRRIGMMEERTWQRRAVVNKSGLWRSISPVSRLIFGCCCSKYPFACCNISRYLV